jgi:hypothetical protein
MYNNINSTPTANTSTLFLYIYNVFSHFIPVTDSSNFITYPRILCFNNPPPPQGKYPYFDVVVGLAWSNDPESYAGISMATGRASHVRQVKVMTQTKWDTLVIQIGGWA